jgi:hypothetical protein
VNAIFGQAYETVRIGKGAEVDPDRGRRGSRFQFAEDAGIHFCRRLEKESALHGGNQRVWRKALSKRLHFFRI